MKKISETQLYLTVIATVSMIASNILAAKQIRLLPGIITSGGTIVFPITYILSDVFSEVYGYRWSRITCYIAFMANLFISVLCQIAIVIPAPDYYQNQEAFATILGSTWRILFASLSAYFIGDFVNDKIFQIMKQKQGERGFCWRAILSSAAGEIIDGALFVIIAFAGTVPNSALISMIGWTPILKIIFEIIILPLTVAVVKKVRVLEQ